MLSEAATAATYLTATVHALRLCQCACSDAQHCTRLLTYQQGVCFGNRHDAHDGGNTASKGYQALHCMPSNVPEGSDGAAMNLGGCPPCQAGQVQLMHVIQEVALQELHTDAS